MPEDVTITQGDQTVTLAGAFDYFRQASFVASTDQVYVLAASVSNTVPAETEAGDTIVAVVMARDTIVNEAGFATVITQANSGGSSQRLRIATKIAAGGDAGSTITFTGGTSGRMGLAVIVLRNAELVDDSAGQATNVSPSVTSAGDNRIALAAFHDNFGGTPNTISVDGDWILRTVASMNDNRIGAATQQVSSGATPTATWTTSTPNDAGALSVVFGPTL